MIDSHCHITYEQENGFTTAQMLENARAANMTALVDIGVVFSDIPKRLALSAQEDMLWSTVGVHPCHAGEEKETPADIRRILEEHEPNPNVVGFGETGFDEYWSENPPLDIQEASFRAHIEAGQGLKMPIVVHSREADANTMRVMDDMLKTAPFQAVIHCFTANAYMADWAAERGFTLGATGVITYKKSQDLRDIFAKFPLEKILIETDSPYLAPVPFRGKTNQPAYVQHVAACLAEVRGLSIDDIKAQAQANTRQFFHKIQL